MEAWQEEYLELMFGNDHSSDSMRVAAEIKYLHMPESLYKYRSFSKNTISALRNDCLYSSNPDSLNDIRESPIEIMTERIRQKTLQEAYNKAREYYSWMPEATVKSEFELADIFREHYSNEYGASECQFPEPKSDPVINGIVSIITEMSQAVFDKELHNIRNMYNVCSFSARNDIELMWAHYSDNHQGFCIQYDFKNYGMFDDRVQLLFPVIYQDHPLVQIDDLGDANSSQAMYALTLKKTDWQYEQEWRMFFTHTEKANPEPMPKPQAIYLGYRCNDENKQMMAEICKDKKIPLFMMTMPSMRLPLIPEQIG